MTLSRRRLLQGVGAGIAAGMVGVPGSASATETERVIVHPEDGPLGDLFGLVEDLGGSTLFEYDNFDFLPVEVPSTRLDDLRAATGVAFIEDDDEIGIPGDWDPSVPDLLDPGGDPNCAAHPPQRPSWGVDRIGATEVEQTGSGVGIGILDTGIQTDHCSLEVTDGRNFTGGNPGDYEDRHGHGTHVAGIAGARDNDLGVVGAAPGSTLYAVKVLADDGSGNLSTLIAGIDWCMSNDVEIISMSLGAKSGAAAMDDAIEAAHAEGHLLLCAAGNEGNDGPDSCGAETMTYPATHEKVIAVTAMNEDDTLASYSSVGSAVDLLAPGTAINSTTVDNRYAESSGTSMACPFVSGVAALVWETREEDGPGPNEEVRDILADTAEPVLGTCAEGHGLVDAPAALGDERADEGGSIASDGPVGTVVEGVVSGLEWLANQIAAFIDWLVSLFR